MILKWVHDLSENVEKIYIGVHIDAYIFFVSS